MTKLVGITGGVGCGKTTVLEILKEITNCRVLLTDEIARDLMKKGGKAYLAIIDFFGQDYLDMSGEIDRVKLSKTVFAEENKRMVLNSIVHPMVKQEVVTAITAEKIEGKLNYVFVESAILFEAHFDKFLDEVWYIYADEEVRRERLKKGRNYSDQRIDAMLKAQAGQDEYIKKCKHVIDNSKDRSITRENLLNLLADDSIKQ